VSPDPIAAIDTRMAQIRARIAGIPPKVTPTSTAELTEVSSLLDATGAGADGISGSSVDSFASLLAGAGARLGTASQTLLGASATAPVPVPAGLRAFGNGRLPDSVLSPIGQGDYTLAAAPAAAFRSMAADAARAGVRITVTDAYRPLDRQESLAAREGLYSAGGLAAAPGTSNHGWGMAVDVATDPSALAWLGRNASRFGFVNDVAREPWHWTFRPVAGAPGVTGPSAAQF